MQPRYILGLVKKWFWLLVLAAIIGGAAGLVVDRLQPKKYQADATVFVNAPNRIDYTALLGAQQAARAFVIFPQSQSILTAALQTVGNTGLSESQLASMVTVQNDLNSQFVDIQVRDSDPTRAARLASAIAKQSINQFQANITGGANTKFLQNEIATLPAEITKEEQEVATQQSQPQPLTVDQQNHINQLNATILAQKQLYSQYLNDNYNLTSIQVSLFQDAQVPDKPVGLGTPLAIAIGILAGLIAILGIILLIEQTDDMLRTPTKVDKATSLPTLITVKHLPEITKQMPWFNGHQPGNGVVVTVKPVAVLAQRVSSEENNYHDIATQQLALPKQVPAIAKPPVISGALSRFELPESFFTLGVLLSSDSDQHDSIDGSHRSLLVTSPENGDGKTLIASQIALGLARIGVRVVLIDTNLRDPRIHKIFGVPNRIGLSSILSTDKIMDETGQMVDTIFGALHQTPEPNLAILPGGPTIDSAPTLLSSSRMADILDQLSQQAFVVIDSPSILTASEAMILASKSDGILMVVNARHTTANKLNQSLRMLSRIHVPVHGVVLNQVRRNNEN